MQVERYSSLEAEGIVSHEQGGLLTSQAKADASAVEADKAAVDAARVQLQYTDILAPINARAGALLINLGNLVKANDTPYLVQLNQVTPIYVTFFVPEGNLDRVRQRFSAGQLKVLAYPKGQSDGPVEGQLTFIDNGVDTTTGMFKLKATFQNKDRRLWPGQFVDVALQLSMQKNAVVVPTKAIQTGQQGEYVYVVRADSTAESRPVKTLGVYQNLTVIADGLNAGEQVIVNGQLRVAPNAAVVVQGSACPEPRRIRLPPRVQPEADCEHLRDLHQAAHHDHAGHGRDFDLRDLRLSTAAGQRPAERGLSHHFGERLSSGRESRHHGFVGGHPAGKAILHHRRHRFDDVGQFSGANQHHYSVQP